MTTFCYRSTITLAIIVVAMTGVFVAAETDAPGELPAPITLPKPQPVDPLDEIAEGLVKPRPYRWIRDDALTPTSQSTVSQFLTSADDVDPNDILERPGIPVGWYTDVELTAANPHLSTKQQSGSLLSGTFADPVAVAAVPMDWTVMPKLTLGYRRPEGVGELSTSYRFLSSQGTGSVPQFVGGGTGSGSTGVQLHVLDLDYSLTELFPTDLWLVPRQVRLTGGIRVAGMRDKTSGSGGTVVGQSAANTFVGAGPRFACEALYPIMSTRWTFFTKADAAGVIGSDRQTFSQTAGGLSASAQSSTAAVAVPVVGIRAGVNWLPDWGHRNVKFSAGYQWEKWFDVGTDTSSYNELTIQGPFFSGEVAF